ncbi:hypothetical protein Micbo1qcDRAFT_226233 [Microdochium bolleyi]|uniref:Uncharacterized protein n=1 Tax=Microdochium bolleyi TaxID=196109 RepID=A0A136J019_9PEZI|nr:hypothetical protein Micbo1qcDRAFT_226233 [Microdochium bolleyi]
MHTTQFFPALLFAALAAAQTNIACNSFGIPDGYQGHGTWRARAEHCTNAIEKLMPSFGQRVPSAEHGCTVLSESETCEIRICDDYNVRRAISYETVWAAAHALHARHRADQTVAGYVSLDDYTMGGNLFRTFIMVAAKDSPDPRGKRRRHTGPDVSIGDRRRDLHELAARASDNHEFDPSEIPIQNTDGLNVNMQAGWGDAEWTGNDQMQNAMENLLVIWNNEANAGGATLRAPGYLAPNNIMVEFEWAANQFNANNAVAYEERATLLRQLIHLRANQGNYGNFAAQLRRGSRTIGHVIIRVFRLVAQQQVGEICG